MFKTQFFQELGFQEFLDVMNGKPPIPETWND